MAIICVGAVRLMATLLVYLCVCAYKPGMFSVHGYGGFGNPHPGEFNPYPTTPHPTPAPCGWKIWVYTSDVKWAGTDSDVQMSFYDNAGQSSQFASFDNPSKDDFERNGIDTFMVVTPKYWGYPKSKSLPTKLAIGHTNKGDDAGWHLDKVILEETCGGKSRKEYPCDCWIGGEEYTRGQMYSRMLYPKSTTQVTPPPSGGQFEDVEICISKRVQAPHGDVGVNSCSHGDYDH